MFLASSRKLYWHYFYPSRGVSEGSVRKVPFLNRGSESQHPMLQQAYRPGLNSASFNDTGAIAVGCAMLGMELSVGRLAAPQIPFVTAPNPHRLPSRIAKEDEHLLVAAAKKGDTGAFEELV